MALSVRRARYYYTTVDNTPGQGLDMFAKLRASNISLLAFTSFPLATGQVQLDFFSDNPDRLKKVLE